MKNWQDVLTSTWNTTRVNRLSYFVIWAYADWVTFCRSSWAPVVILLKKMDSAALPPRVMHILSNICSVVYKNCSRGRYMA